MSSGLPVGAFKAPPEKTLQSRRPPESDATERPPRDRLPSACMTRCARGSSPEGSGGRGPWLGIDVKDYFLEPARPPLPEGEAESRREARPGEGVRPWDRGRFLRTRNPSPGRLRRLDLSPRERCGAA